jgi:20S proteasome alpha/beta subunit
MDIIQKIIRDIQKIRIGRTAAFKGREKSFREDKKTETEGTTILALKYDKGVIIAADTRCVAGETIFSDKVVKIEEVGSLSCLAGAGYVSDFQILVDALRNELTPKLEKFWEKEIFVDGQANLIKEIMRNCFLETWIIIAGWNPFKKEGYISLIDPGGAIYDKFDDYIATGSGGNYAKAVLKIKWFKNCSKEKGIQIAIEALLAASEIDRNTSKSIPAIKVISSERIINVKKKDIKKALQASRQQRRKK